MHPSAPAKRKIKLKQIMGTVSVRLLLQQLVKAALSKIKVQAATMPTRR
jgi:hypothetical protein